VKWSIGESHYPIDAVHINMFYYYNIISITTLQQHLLQL